MDTFCSKGMKLLRHYDFSEFTQLADLLVAQGSEKSTGKPIQIHLFKSHKSNEAKELCAVVMSLPESARKLVLKFGFEEAGGYFVTEPLPQNKSLKAWIEEEAARSNGGGMPEIRPETTDQLRDLDIYPSALAPLVPGPDGGGQSAPPRQAERVEAEPGLYTQLYGRDQLKGGSSMSAAASAQSVPAPVPAQIVQPPVQAAPAQVATQSGGETAFFERLYEGARPARAAAPAVTPTSPPKTADTPRTSTTNGGGAPGLETWLREMGGGEATAPGPARNVPAHSPVVQPPPARQVPPRHAPEGPVLAAQPRALPEPFGPEPGAQYPPVTPRPLSAPLTIDPTPTGRMLDWKLAGLIVLGLILLAVLILLLVENI